MRNFSPRISQWNVWFGADRPEASSVEVSKARARALGSRLREAPGPVLGIYRMRPSNAIAKCDSVQWKQ